MNSYSIWSDSHVLQGHTATAPVSDLVIWGCDASEKERNKQLKVQERERGSCWDAQHERNEEREKCWDQEKASFTVPPFSQGEGAVRKQAASHWRSLLPTAWIGSTEWQDLNGTQCPLAQCLLCSLNPSYSAFLFFEFTIVLLHPGPFSWYLERFSSFPFT